MKKFINYLLIAFIGIACDKIEDPWGDVIPSTLSAYTPEFGSNTSNTRSSGLWEDQPESWDGPASIETRTFAIPNPSASNKYIQYWSHGDAISLFFTTQNLKYVLYDFGDTSDYGHFQLAGDSVSGENLSTGYYYSVYPYKEDTEMYDDGIVTYTFPETQHYNGDSYANGENGMIARVGVDEWNLQEPDKCDLYFQNFCSYLELRLYTDKGVNKSVQAITLTANSTDDKIAGRGDIEYAGNEPVVYMYYEATNKITLDCGGVTLSQNADAPTKFWFVVPGGFTFTEGFNITVIFSDNNYFKKSTTKQIGIERNHIKPMVPFKPENAKPTAPIRYKYNSGSKEEPYPLKNTFYDKDGYALDIVDQRYDEETNEWVVLLSGTLKTIGGNSFNEPGPDIEYIKVANEESVKVDGFAFYNCTADNLIIQNSVDEINESAFTGSTIKDLNIDGNVTTIKNSAGTGSNIENINITGSVQIIEEQAFSGCGDLKTVNISNVETIGYRAFYDCANLKEVCVPGVKYVDAGAFRSCISLETIDLRSVVTIEDNAFMDCSSLTEAIISENCTLIGEGAFCNAVSLQTVYCYAVEPPFIKTDNSDKSYVFDNTHANLVIYVPAGSKGKYTNRNYFANHTYDDPKIKAKVNWWQQEYRGKLTEM